MSVQSSFFLEICGSSLSVSRDTANCISRASGYFGLTTHIALTQTLQKKKYGNTWIDMDMWNNDYYGHTCLAKNQKNGISNGIYRLKTVFYVYSENECELHTKFSNEVIV